MRTLGVLGFLLLLPALALSISCVPEDKGPDDESLVGEFRVTGTLQSNTCAPGFNPVTPSTFTARLFVDAGRATWSAAGNTVTGTASGSSFHVVARGRTTVLTSCVLEQTETLDGSYSVTRSDAGSPDAGPVRSGTVTGTDSITFTTNGDPACLNLLISYGGNFPMLPCTAAFDFSGTTN